MTDEDIEKIIKRHMSLQMNLAGIRADFEKASRKPFVGLTDEEIDACDPHDECWGLHEVVRLAEAKLREKNT